MMSFSPSPSRSYGRVIFLCWLSTLAASPSAAQLSPFNTDAAKSETDLTIPPPVRKRLPLPPPTLLNAMPLQPMDNNQESAPPSPPPATKTIYSSPGVVLRRESHHLVPPANAQVSGNQAPRNLADLAPAAGEIEAPAPLIPVPSAVDTSAPVPPLQTVEAPTLPPVPPNESNYDAAALDSLMRSLPVSTPAITAPHTSAVQEAPQPAPEEPKPELSEESKKIIEKIPSGMDQEKPATSPIAIDHAKDTSYVSKSEGVAGTDGEATVGNDAMGIKIRVNKVNTNTNYELEKAYNALLNGQTGEAIKIYSTVLANDDKNKLALFGLATTYHRIGQIDMARPLYAKLLAIDPDNRDALNNFLVLLGDEAPQEALNQMQVLEDRNPGFSPIPAQMAVIYQKLGDTETARQKMVRAVTLAPENLTYKYNLAIMLDTQKKYGEAAKLYRQLMNAHMRGEVIPGDASKIQERLTFISSNRP
jgi:Tfp pilus assembly protein PilF